MNSDIIGRAILAWCLLFVPGMGLSLALAQSDDRAFETAKSLLTAAYKAKDATSAVHLGESALAKLSEANPETREQAEFFVFKGFVLDFLEQPREALQAFAAAAKLDPENPRPISMQGDINLYLERPEIAVPFFKSLIELVPDDPEGHHKLGIACFEMGDFQQAEKAFRATVELDAENAQAKRDLAAVFSKLGRFSEALPIWVAFADADAADLDAHWNVAQTWQLMRKPEEAEQAFLAYLEKDPGDWRGLEKICQVSESLGKTAQRDDYLGKLYALHASDDPPQTLAEQGFFIRDQFDSGDLRIYALECFDLKGARAVKYSLSAYREPPGEEREFINRISLGSYESTNRIAHELGDLEKDERRYHLDMYPPDGSHATLGFFTGNPGYAAVKELAIKGFRDELEPLSSSGPAK